jgi:ribonuclease HI
MQRALSNLKKHLCSFLPEEIIIGDDDFQSFVNNTWVVLPAGGRGMRLREITGVDINKNVLLINDNLTIIERVILMYRGVGIKNFLVLVYHGADSVKDVLGDGSKFGVNIKYSYDPEKPVGRGGAILNALMQGLLPEDAFSVCHNPVDQIVDYPEFAQHILRQHWYNYTNKKVPATIVVSMETPYNFTGMQIVDNLVQEISMYPMIPVPAHVGVTCFSPEVYQYFKDLFNLAEAVDFESRLFPILAAERKLAAFGIDYHQWIPIKDNKQLQLLRQKLQADIVDEVKSDKGYYSLFVDGGSKGNPGPAAIGGVIYDEVFNGVKTFKEYIGEATNNQAEYRALIKGLSLAKELGIKLLKLNMDSELVIKHLTGEYAVKDEQLKKYYNEAVELLSAFDDVRKRHVKREFNKMADSLVNEAIKDAGVR